MLVGWLEFNNAYMHNLDYLDSYCHTALMAQEDLASVFSGQRLSDLTNKHGRCYGYWIIMINIGKSG